MTNSTRAYRMRHMGEMKRRRARWLALLACTTSALAMLGGCGNPTAQGQSGNWDSGNNDAIVYKSLDECKAAQPDDRICDEALAEATAAQGQQHYSRKEQCEAEFGAGHCESRAGGSWFVPAMTGFMLARALSGTDLNTYIRRNDGNAVAPVYAGGTAYTPSRQQGGQPAYKSSSRGGFGGSSGYHGGSGG